MEEKKYTLLPADDAVQTWFEENIQKDCGASSAIYKFRQWLRSLSAESKSGPEWVKVSDRLPGYETPVKWRDGKDHSHVTDGKIPLIHMAKPFLIGWEWLDESRAAPSGEREIAPSKEVIDFVRDIAANWDCDEDGHKYNTGCRKCSASELLYDITKQQKEKQ